MSDHDEELYHLSEWTGEKPQPTGAVRIAIKQTSQPAFQSMCRLDVEETAGMGKQHQSYREFICNQ